MQPTPPCTLLSEYTALQVPEQLRGERGEARVRLYTAKCRVDFYLASSELAETGSTWPSSLPPTSDRVSVNKIN